MHVLFFEPDPSFGGGSERVCLDLARGLVARGHRISLLHDRAGSMLPDYDAAGARRSQMELRPFGWRTLGASLLRARRIARVARSMSADVMIASELHYLRSLALASSLGGPPVLFHLGLTATHREWSWRWAYRRVSAGVAPSTHTLRSWQESGWPAETLVEISNGVDTTRFQRVADRASARQKFGLPPNAPLINYTGRLAPEKGVATLLTAFQFVLAEIPECVLVMVGRDEFPGERWRQRAAELGLPAERVRFLGARPDPEAFMAAADVVVVPSEVEESFGLTVAEAMACGVPVVTTQVGILPHLLGPDHQHWVARTGDAKDIARILRGILANPDRSTEAGRALRARAVEQFEMSRCCAAYERVLGRCCGCARE
ncbi:MAG: glycosyltransferase family 4 protein [Acidobacteria bacterium]|nr:glycosyltransferase family 4 protein [Acidobacteriota bacterium]